MRRLRALLWLLGLCALSACGSGGEARMGDYVGGNTPVECAPFARALTGVQLRGDSEDWWQQAAGRYQRTASPAVGSILVLRRSGRLPDGHVAVVTRLLSGRQVLVTQANWVHHRVTEDQPVIDVSPGNDWTVVRLWWPPSGQMGITDYAVVGFILPDRPASHDQLIAETPRAVRLAENE
jgi:CHAP domain